MYAIITGASSGLGKELSYLLAHQGYDLILVARRLSLLEEVKDNLQEKDIDVVCLNLDLSLKDNVYKLFKTVEEYNVEILINNAGIGYLGDFYDTDLIRQNKIIDLNIIAVQIATKIFLDKYKKGKIINIGSLAGCLPTPNHSVYSASKAYINNFSRAISYELKVKKNKIKVYTVLPGPVKTEFSTNAEAKINRGMDASKCAKIILREVKKNKEVIIPGFKFKIIYLMSRILPTKLLMKIAYRIQKSK